MEPWDTEPPAGETGVRNSKEPDTIVVTGSHIRGLDAPVGSNLITIDREEIDRQGYANARDLSEDILQNFGGGATGERQQNPASSQNVGYGTTINLRGLGNLATLVLINGRRVPAVGQDGGVADISFIPISALERVEVLPDGASAVYGSDAVAGVVNFILRKDYEGFEARVRYGFATEASVQEYQFGQSGGQRWGSGSLFLSYEFYHRDRLPADDRPFTRTQDLRSQGGKDYRLIYGQPGNIINPLTSAVLFAIPPGQDGRNLTPGQLLGPEQTNFTDENQYIDMLPEQRRHSVFAYLRQELTPAIALFAEGRYGHRRFSSHSAPPWALLTVTPGNPYYVDANGNGAPVFVAYSFTKEHGPVEVSGASESYSGSSGLNIDMGSQWQTQAYVSYSRDKSRTIIDQIDYAALTTALIGSPSQPALNPFGSGTSNSPALISGLFRKDRIIIDADVLQANITSDGDVAQIWGNTLRAAFGIDYRDYHYETDNRFSESLNADLSREVLAIFGELFIPLVSPSNDIAGFRRLELSVSARHERHKDRSREPQEQSRDRQTSTDPRIGLVWEPFSGLRINGSYGTSFRSPSLNALTATASLSAIPVADPLSPSGQTRLLVVNGAERDLRNETADTWTIGAEIAPQQLPELRLKANYFSINFDNLVDRLPFPTLVLADPALSGLVVRNPSLDQVQSYCNLVDPQNWFISPGDCTAPGQVAAAYDWRLRNISEISVSGIDAQATYSADLEEAGILAVSLSATYLLDYEKQLSSTTPKRSFLDTPGNLVDLRARGTVSWQLKNGLLLSTDINYTDSYKDPVHDRKINSWTTIDLTIAYEISEKVTFGLLRNTSVRLNVNNIFENDPPFYENADQKIGFDPTNADATGRFISFNIVKRW